MSDEIYRELLANLEGKQAREFTEQQWKRYKEKHPGADPKKHKIKGKGDRDQSKDDKPSKGDKRTQEREKLLKKRDEEHRKRLPKELQDYGEPAGVDDLPKEFREAIKDYKIEVVGDDAAQAVEIARKVKKGIEDSADVCKMSPPVCEGNMGLTRDKMPQITDDSVKSMLNAMDEKEFDKLAKDVKKGGLGAIKDSKKRKNFLQRAKGLAAVQAGADPDSDKPVFNDFLDSLSGRGVRTKNEEIPVGQLKATQSEIQAAKVFGMADSHLKGDFDGISDSVTVSRDGHILDGHHRWAAILTIDPKRKMKVKVVDMDMKELLDEAAGHPGVFKADISGLPLDEKAQKEYKSKSKKKAAFAAKFKRATLKLAQLNPAFRQALLKELRLAGKKERRSIKDKAKAEQLKGNRDKPKDEDKKKKKSPKSPEQKKLDKERRERQVERGQFGLPGAGRGGVHETKKQKSQRPDRKQKHKGKYAAMRPMTLAKIEVSERQPLAPRITVTLLSEKAGEGDLTTVLKYLTDTGKAHSGRINALSKKIHKVAQDSGYRVTGLAGGIPDFVDSQVYTRLVVTLKGSFDNREDFVMGMESVANFFFMEFTVR